MTEKLKCNAPEILSTRKYEDIPKKMREELERNFPRGMGCEGGLVSGWWCLNSIRGDCKYVEYVEED